MPSDDHSDEALRVWPSRTDDEAWWSPLYGDIDTPSGWDSQEPGDPFITRQIKQMGPHWVALRRRKGYTETLGILAPAANIEAARRLAEETESRRSAARSRSQEQRVHREDKYRQVFAEAVLSYLDFAPRHQALAQKIAQEVAGRATEVGSGRVGRTARLTLEDKAELAARAHIRHSYTKYEDRLVREGVFDAGTEIPWSIRADAHEEVDAFLRKHRWR